VRVDFHQSCFSEVAEGEARRGELSSTDPNLDIDKEAFHASESPAMRYLMQEFDGRKQGFKRDSGPFFLDLPSPLDDLTINGIVNEGEMMIPR
jgi:hypothetical protein